MVGGLRLRDIPSTDIRDIADMGVYVGGDYHLMYAHIIQRPDIHLRE